MTRHGKTHSVSSETVRCALKILESDGAVGIARVAENVLSRPAERRAKPHLPVMRFIVDTRLRAKHGASRPVPSRKGIGSGLCRGIDPVEHRRIAMLTMKWEELTARDFPKAVKKARAVCIVPLGCLEKHGEHLPTGTDLFQARAVAKAAVAIEPAVIFPSYYLTQIQCGKHQPGAVALPGRLITELLEGVCDEIARNGLDKIILLNGHGGNENWLAYASWMMAHDPRHAFTVYVARLGDYWANDVTPQYAKRKQSKVDGHGGEKETSLMLAVRPDVVRMADIGQPGNPLGRVKHLPLFTPHSWYANQPGHYKGDGSYGTAEKGKVLLAELSRNVATIIRAVKRDTVAPRLRQEFLRKAERPVK